MYDCAWRQIEWRKREQSGAICKKAEKYKTMESVRKRVIFLKKERREAKPIVLRPKSYYDSKQNLTRSVRKKCNTKQNGKIKVRKTKKRVFT